MFPIMNVSLKGGERRTGPILAGLGTALTLTVIVANFVLFDRVNRLVATIHLHPYAGA
jgi:hypothetical protein